MFCQNCGKENQKENSYCRKCGEFLPRSSKGNLLAWGGRTPEEQIRTSLVLNLITALSSIIMGTLLLSTMDNRGDKTFIVIISGALLLTIGIWQISNFVVGLKLRKHFKKRWEDEEDNVGQEIYSSPKTTELLPEAEFEDVIPASVTEITTRNLTKN